MFSSYIQVLVRVYKMVQRDPQSTPWFELGQEHRTGEPMKLSFSACPVLLTPMVLLQSVFQAMGMSMHGWIQISQRVGTCFPGLYSVPDPGTYRISKDLQLA